MDKLAKLITKYTVAKEFFGKGSKEQTSMYALGWYGGKYYLIRQILGDLENLQKEKEGK